MNVGRLELLRGLKIGGFRKGPEQKSDAVRSLKSSALVLFEVLYEFLSVQIRTCDVEIQETLIFGGFVVLRGNLFDRLV